MSGPAPAGPAPAALAARKAAARTWARNKLKGLEGRQAAGAAMAARLAALSVYRAARVVLAFAPMGCEPDITPFLTRVLADGKMLCLPACTGPGQMEARRVQALSALQPGAYGIAEAPGPALAPGEIDLAVIPCLAAGADGTRLGRGAGYYDRYLPALRPEAVKVALCRAALLRPTVPAGALDVPMDAVLTECGVYGELLLQKTLDNPPGFQ